MQTAIIILLLLICAVLLNALISLERGLRRARDQIRAHMDGQTGARLSVPCPNAAAEELLETVNELLELRQLERAEGRRREEDLRRQIAGVSHDLRTPLTSILGYLQLLEDGDLSPERRAEYLSVVRGRAVTLQALITAFYDLSRAEGGAWKLEREPVDLAAVTAEQLAAAREQLEGAGLRVSPDIPEGLPPVWGDSGAVTRVVSNLLTNALRHGADHLTVRLYREGEHVVSRFSNAAPGLSPEDAHHVFDRAWTGDRARTGRGTGLGLAIVRALCERMGCRADAELSHGEFSVQLTWRAVS